MAHSISRPRVLFAVAVLTFAYGVGRTVAADWNAKLAADYLDGRQKAWFAWAPASSPDGACVSCHTGMPYLLARPALRRVLGESEPTIYEKGILARLHAKAGAKPPSVLQEVEVIFAAMFLAQKNQGSPIDDDTRKTFDQLWTLQRREGPGQGAWRWYAANLDPWEHAGSEFYGAALAGLAVAAADPEYRRSPFVAERAAALTSYLRAPTTTPRPLHDQLAALWAASRLPDIQTAAARLAVLAETFAKQEADGGWSIQSLGPWSSHANAPPNEGTNAYATAFVAFVLQRAGVSASDPRLGRALTWLQTHQDPVTGAWAALSMNKRYPPDSMEILFMQDAATAFAALALIEAGR